MSQNQSGLFKGIYQFEDTSGSLVASKVPIEGTADLYDGTQIIVEPNQCAVFIYKGKIADILPAGTHTVKTENLPLITRLANWRFGFESPLQSEIWFFSGATFAALKWGSTNPVVHAFEKYGTIALRAFGNYSLAVRNPVLLFNTLIGSRNSLHIDDLQDYVQGQILEILPQALDGITEIEKLGVSQPVVSKKLTQLLGPRLTANGLAVAGVQVLSIVPPDEIMRALETKAAMNVIGDEKTYLLYKAANSLEGNAVHPSQDPMAVMMAMMLGRTVAGGNAAAPGMPLAIPGAVTDGHFCTQCGKQFGENQKFCAKCGAAA